MKIHLVSDSQARPLALHVIAGQASDAPAFETVMAKFACRGPVLGDREPGRRSSWQIVRTSRAIRGHLRRRGIGTVIPQPADQVGHRLRRGRYGGRPPGFDLEAYRQRNTVERCINRIKQWRGLAMRSDKLAVAYQVALHLAATLIWTRR
ncbi:transposase [Streptosporangium longisporum]|uniref:Transposase IS4-like domain-containing protein n=1 Tax=Streptosporangium longisporum TaxID=46187 RepID=A0ABN3Y791_9ACTN